MLPRSHRLTDSVGFTATVRRGRRAASRTLVVHADLGNEDGGTGARVGFVVSKAVGPAVTRNRVKRRLRHQARELLDALPGSAVLVVRALPAAATASSEELRADLARCLQRVDR
ncbi:ribonuclease P protein component [Nocardioides sp.]|uniref:ribonuclease P protein component n=1 Tax=Nocardioides sp. TaxID=35761 RepID=UPI00261DF9FF|nr:ribonuclease P protein component [Nocardioides sp.]